jgi:hypothetical protein
LCFLPPSLRHIGFRSFSVHSSHLSFGLRAFLFPSVSTGLVGKIVFELRVLIQFFRLISNKLYDPDVDTIDNAVLKLIIRKYRNISVMCNVAWTLFLSLDLGPVSKRLLTPVLKCEVTVFVS